MFLRISGKGAHFKEGSANFIKFHNFYMFYKIYLLKDALFYDYYLEGIYLFDIFRYLIFYN